MQARLLLSSIIASFLIVHMVRSEEVITLFVKPYPIAQSTRQQTAVTNSFKNPGKIAEYCLIWGLCSNVSSGIFFSYAGFLSITNSNGQAIFPRRQTDPELNLLITDKLTPITISSHLVDHWELEEGTPAAMYYLERSFDPAAELYYWNIEPVELPADRKIPLATIIMFAKPKHIYVPVGASVASGDPNLVLPDLYVKKAIKAPTNALYLLGLRQFFGPIGFIEQKKDLHQSFNLYDWP